MSVILGKDVALQLKVDGDYATIGCAVSCTFEFTNELIGKTDVNAGLFRKKRVRMSDCRGSVQGVTLSDSTATRLSPFFVLQEGIRRSELDMRFVYTDQSGNDKVISGLFLVQTISLVADASAFTDFDISLEGTGGIDISDVNIPGDVVCDEMFRDTWRLAEGATSISGLGTVDGLSFAGKRIIGVYREGDEYDPATVVGNRNYVYDLTSISFLNPGNPADPDTGLESIFVIFMDDAS